ncbi:MAG: FAD-dependent oxidoreductase [Saprospiraceae bacterium]|nr:FAD-dependent oxidoreductase [Saprospiraceae bacterium]
MQENQPIENDSLTMNRLKNLSRVEHEEFDLCIIGGGATGLGCALDAALRGFKVVLMERDDFASATSSKSTKLFHGGVRYLEQAVKKLDMEQFRMVNKALNERKTLIKNAPHLAQPLALLTPCYSWWEGIYYAIGLKIYDWLAGKTNLASSEWLSKKAALRRVPQLNEKRLKSAVLYFDGHFDDTRYALAIAKTADSKGAVLLNHVETLGFTRNTEGVLTGLQVRETLNDEDYLIKAKLFVNATGPFSDRIRQLANPKAATRMRVSKGVHLVLPRDLMPGDTAVLIPKTDDGRVIFMLPWQRRLLVGTTDEECKLTEKEIALEKDDVAYLLKYVNRYFNKEIKPEQVKSGFGGLRPLLQADPSEDAKSLVRDHEVEVDKTSGLISIMGGKWTTYRLMAKDTIDKCEQILRGDISECATDKQLLIGAENWVKDDYKRLARKFGIPEYVTRRLNRRYGTEAIKVLMMIWKDPTLRHPIVHGSPIIKAEVLYVTIHEMPCNLKDLMSRRLGLELTDWQQTLDVMSTVASLMQEALWFSSTERERMIALYQKEIIEFKRTAGFEI